MIQSQTLENLIMKQKVHSEILDYESEDIDITNEPGILTNSGTVEFEDLPSFAIEDAQYEPVHHPQPSASTLVLNSNPVPQLLAEVTSSTISNPVPPPSAEIMSSAKWSESSTTSDESKNNSDKGPSAIKRKCKTRGGLQHKNQVRTRGGIRTGGAANILDNNIVDNSVRKCRGRGQPTVCSQIRSKLQQGGRYNRGGQKKHGDCCQGGPRNNQPVPLVWKPISKNTYQILEDIPMFEQEGLQIRM